MEARQETKIILTVSDKIIKVIGWVCVLLMWLLIFLFFSKLPDRYIMYGNSGNNVEDVRTKSSILLLPIIGTGLFFVLICLSKFPRLANFIKEWKNNDEKERRISFVRSLLFLSAIFSFVLLFEEFYNIQMALDKSSMLDNWIIYLGIVIIGFITAIPDIKNWRKINSLKK